MTGVREWPEDIRIVHGEEGAKKALAARLRAGYERLNRPLVKITAT